jgi:hypothetical protein
MQAPDDDRGLFIQGLLVLKNGELAAGCFAYPSSTNPTPMACVPYCLKLQSAYEREPERYVATGQSQENGSAHGVFGDDKFCVSAYSIAPDASFITLMLSSLYPERAVRYDRHRHRNDRQTDEAPPTWQDAEQRTWCYDKISQFYRLDQSLQAEFTSGSKHQFIPHERCRAQALRDLLPKPSPSDAKRVKK